MRSHITGIDHVVVLVRDLDRALASFSALGFKPTPRGHHSIGTQNHCLMFGHDYLELLTVVKPHPVTAYFSSFLDRHEGLAAVAFSSDDAQAAYEDLVSAGIAADAPVEFSRPVDVPGGPQDARFRVVQLPVTATPGVRAFVCQHFTRQLVWRPEFMDHGLRVRGIAGLTIAAPDALHTAAQYATVLGAEVQRAGAAIWVSAGSVRFDFVARPSMAAGSAEVDALQLAVDDLPAATALLQQAGQAPQRLGDGLVAIAPAQAHGIRLLLSAAAPGAS